MTTYLLLFCRFPTLSDNCDIKKKKEYLYWIINKDLNLCTYYLIFIASAFKGR